MKKAVIGFLISAFLVAGCAIGFGRHGNLIVVPALPVTVEVDADQYYYQNGYYYHYNGVSGTTPSEEKDHGGICREATILGKFATRVVMTAVKTIAITIIGSTTDGGAKSYAGEPIPRCVLEHLRNRDAPKT